MSTVDHGHRHVWTGSTRRATRCAYMFCQARPTTADLARLRVEAEQSRRMHYTIEYRTRR
jgi:hypothetical protein